MVHYGKVAQCSAEKCSAVLKSAEKVSLPVQQEENQEVYTGKQSGWCTICSGILFFFS